MEKRWRRIFHTVQGVGCMPWKYNIQPYLFNLSKLHKCYKVKKTLDNAWYCLVYSQCKAKQTSKRKL